MKPVQPIWVVIFILAYTTVGFFAISYFFLYPGVYYEEVGDEVNPGKVPPTITNMESLEEQTKILMLSAEYCRDRGYDSADHSTIDLEIRFDPIGATLFLDCKKKGAPSESFEIELRGPPERE